MLRSEQASGCEGVSAAIAGDVRQFGRRVPLAEMVARIDSLSTKEIKAVRKRNTKIILRTRS